MVEQANSPSPPLWTLNRVRCANRPARNLCGGCNPHCRFRHCDGGCDHCAAICGRRRDLSTRLQEINGLELDMPLSPQPQTIPLPHFVPQLIAPPDMPVILDHEAIIGSRTPPPGTPLQRQTHLVDHQSTAKRKPIPDTDPPSPVVWGG